ncbi:MAG: septum formation protein Maf [Opitutaceae bacterium]|jgi:septum formation protein|nr:septum formation protein Maf [Opitutaceae bacterium]
MSNDTANLILASASPRRHELLRQLGIPFEVQVADVVEQEERDRDPRQLVAHNANLKASWVADRNPAAWILGADTTVFVDEQVLNKPADLKEARSMLMELSGRSHSVFTGMVLLNRGKKVRIERGVESLVYFRELTDDVITAYLEKVYTLDKAGGYAIQESGEMIVMRYEGSLSNIIGLPLDETKHILTDAGLLT